MYNFAKISKSNSLMIPIFSLNSMCSESNIYVKVVFSSVVKLSPIVARGNWEYQWNALRGQSFIGIVICIEAIFSENDEKFRTAISTSATGN